MSSLLCSSSSVPSDYKVSTQTFVVYGNYGMDDFDLEKAFERTDVDEHIVGAKYGLKRTGDLDIDTKKKKHYLNCLTLSVYSVDKRISAKIFRNGSVQVTGCKIMEHVLTCINAIYKVLGFERVDNVYLLSVMMNANFDMGYSINREKLGHYLINNYHMNIPPLMTGYMGVKITLPVYDRMYEAEMTIPSFFWSRQDGFRYLRDVPYCEYFAADPLKLSKQFRACIGIFQNGKILISSVNKNAIDFAHDWVKRLFAEARDLIEIKPKIVKTFKR